MKKKTNRKKQKNGKKEKWKKRKMEKKKNGKKIDIEKWKKTINTPLCPISLKASWKNFSNI